MVSLGLLKKRIEGHQKLIEKLKKDHNITE
jgi:hypothetical protein